MDPAGGQPAVESRTASRPELLERLLLKTSRTFALSIPVLPEPTRQEVTVAYLLFRIADTLEDATSWTRGTQLEELDRLARLLEEPRVEQAGRIASGWIQNPPCSHDGYLELLTELPAVLQAFLGLSAQARELVARHTRRTIAGMSSFLHRQQAGLLHLRDIAELREYCYAVAGIVGEMLTELFLLGSDRLGPVAPLLRRRAATFGEGLQLVNILKDSASDAREGRSYLPPGHDPAEVLKLARGNLVAAGGYVLCLHEARAPRGVVAFAALPVLLAWGSLARIEAEGPGAKLDRQQVRALVAQLDRALDGASLQTAWAELCASVGGPTRHPRATDR